MPILTYLLLKKIKINLIVAPKKQTYYLIRSLKRS